MLTGIDVSKWQTKTPPLGGQTFLGIKASQYTTPDPMYATHYANARKAGVVVFAYCFGMPASVTPISDQVSTFIATARDADFLFLDQEGAMSDVDAQAFIDEVRLFGKTCGLYHSSSGFGGVKADAKWVADYRDPSLSYPLKGDRSGEFPGWDIWQYTDKGQVAGYTGNLDLNRMNPASPLAVLLRRGYITESASATRVALATDPLFRQIESLTSQRDSLAESVRVRDLQISKQAETIEAMANDIANLEAALKAAPEIERNRIASAEADRIKDL